jgi:hypothetical protein
MCNKLYKGAPFSRELSRRVGEWVGRGHGYENIPYQDDIVEAGKFAQRGDSISTSTITLHILTFRKKGTKAKHSYLFLRVIVIIFF